MRDEAIRPPARLSLILLLVAVIGAAAVHVSVHRSISRERDTVLTQARKHGIETVARRTWAQLEPLFGSSDRDAITAAAETLILTDPNLEGLRISFPDGATVVLGVLAKGSARAESGPIAVACRDPSGLSPIVAELDPPGQDLAPVLGGVVIMFGLVSLAIRRRLLRLAELAHRVSGGRFDDLPRISGRDEISWIAETISDMADLIREQIDRVHGRNATLQHDVTVQSFRLERLARFAAKLVAPVEHEAAPREALRALAADCNADIALLFGPELDGGDATLIATLGVDLHSAEACGASEPEVCAPLIEVASSPTLRELGPLGAQHPWVRGTGRQIPLGGAVACPLRFQGGIEGVVVLAARNGFPDHELELIEDCTRPFAIALANRRAYKAQVTLASALEARNDDLLLQHDQLEQANRLRDQFVANMSHELRTPLGAILGYAELLVDGIYGDIQEEQKTPLAGIMETGRHLLQLVNQVLDLSRAESEIDLDPQPCDLAEVGREALRMTRHVAKDRPYEPILDAEPATVVTDGERVRQIVVNLLGNAIKFTERGSVSVSIRATPEGGATISVKDTGAGIDAANVEMIFEEFRQVDGSSTRAVDGAGLGLAISRRLARALGGDLRVHSDPGQGSTFVLTLPASAPEVSFNLAPETQEAA